jgi:hypothetical protein
MQSKLNVMRTKFYETNDKLRGLMYKRFVHYLPDYLDVAFETEQSEEVKLLTNAMDYFEFHYRHYISDMHKTLHRVLHETRNLTSLKGFDNEIIKVILKQVEKDILESELYELMPRFIKAKQKVEQEIFKNKML